MTKACTIYLVRHGQSVFNRDAIISGHATDPALTGIGRRQAYTTKQSLALGKVHFDDAYSSDLQRAVDTAEIIYGKAPSEENRLHGLRERKFGSLDGKHEKHLQGFKDQVKTLPHHEGWVYKHVPGMESDHEVSLRFMKTLEKIAVKNPGKTVLVVGHGSAIRTLIIRLKNLTNKEFPPGSFKNSGYAKLVYHNGEFRVEQIVS